MTATTLDAATVTATINAQLAALGDVSDVPNTERAQAAFHRDRSALLGRLKTIPSCQRALDQISPELDRLATWLRHLQVWRSELDEARSGCAPRARHNLELSARVLLHGYAALDGSGYELTTLRLGELMQRDGFVPVDRDEGRSPELPWYGSLREVEQKVRALTAERDEHAVRLERALIG
jgi:hypothetical protein